MMYAWMVWSEGRSVIRNFIPLNSMRAGAGRMSFCLMLLLIEDSRTLTKPPATVQTLMLTQEEVLTLSLTLTHCLSLSGDNDDTGITCGCRPVEGDLSSGRLMKCFGSNAVAPLLAKRISRRLVRNGNNNLYHNANRSCFSGVGWSLWAHTAG